jgi:serine/threonine-protein kinase RsbW
MNREGDPESEMVGDVAIPSDPAEARRVQEEINNILTIAGRFSDHELFGIRLAVEEALVNAIKHGNQMDRAKQVRIRYVLRAQLFEIHIMDEGPGFDPAEVPDPTAIENLERPCGRGLMLMRHYMSEVSFSSQGNSVRMSKVPRNGEI